MVSIWQGERVRLRGVEPGDWETFFQWNEDTDSARRSWYIGFPESAQTVQQWTAAAATTPAQTDHYRFQIVNRDDQLVGTLNTHSCNPRNGTFAYGIVIARAHQQKGYASDALRVMLRYYFRELRYQKVNATVYNFNAPSIALHERFGFQLEGRLRRMIYTDGQFHDELLFGMTAEEFAARYPSF